jgi:hypothetical protein
LAARPGTWRFGQESTLAAAVPDPLDLVWHLGGFFAPAIGTGLVTATLAKLIWRRALAGVPWRRLVLAPVLGAAVVLVVGLVLGGRDGRMSTYAAMVVACAVGVWWTGFRPGRS